MLTICCAAYLLIIQLYAAMLMVSLCIQTYFVVFLIDKFDRSESFTFILVANQRRIFVGSVYALDDGFLVGNAKQDHGNPRLAANDFFLGNNHPMPLKIILINRNTL